MYVKIFLTTLFLATSACSSFQRPKYHQLELEQDVWVREGRGVSELKKKGDVVSIDAEPLYLEAPGHIGVVVTPSANQPAKYTLSLRPIEKWGGENVEKVVNRAMTESLENVVEAQLLLGKNQPQEALTKIRLVQKKYPGVSYLKFVEASCLVVLGRKAEAKKILQAALSDYPNNMDARELYLALGGEAFWAGVKKQ